jgi:hypothetical protein
VNTGSWVSLVALSGWLILMLGAFRSHRIGGRRMLTMALAWGSIFLLVTAVISAIDSAE